tara:strand:+ start:2955 stop:3605 length:651 start_codon:yes stop_codon:yes gene_type:complete
MATPTHADIWKKMSAIDVSEFVKSRGVGNRTLSWIPWSDCLALLQAHYPNFEYEFFPVTLYPDGSAEVGCEVTIGDVSRRVDLPVMDHKFNAIVAGAGSSPSSRDINDGRWRAFVKATAILTGLGFQLYRDGSGIPVPVKPTKPTKKVAAKKPTSVDGEKILAERLEVLGAILEACEEHGGVDSHHLTLGREIISEGGPLARADKAIAFLEREVGR